MLDHVLPEVPIRQFVLTVPFPALAPSQEDVESIVERASNEDGMVNRSLARTRQVYLVVPVATAPRQRTLQS